MLNPQLPPVVESMAAGASDKNKGLLRFITCGNVDDGKSTLIGRLLHDAGQLYDDQLQAVIAESGRPSDEVDFSRLLDGLAAEREQGITIDVAYRFFATEARKFIVADTPGHEEYTRNMVTAASTADAAVLLVDARKNIQTQTFRHTCLVRLLGIKHLIVVINKMDQVDYSEARFNRLRQDYLQAMRQEDIGYVSFIPVSALLGDNIVRPAAQMPWYQGATLIGCLENVPLDDQPEHGGFRMPVQWVNRADQDFRGYAGRIVSGSVRPGDAVCILPSGKVSKVDRIVTYDGDLDQAEHGQSVTLTLTDAIDISRGDMLVSATDPAAVGRQFEVSIVWLDNTALLPGRQYILQSGSRCFNASITDIRYRLNVNSMAQLAARQLELNDIGVCHISLDQDLPFDPYQQNRDTGSFILVDPVSNNTVAAGLIHFALRRSSNIQLQPVDTDKQIRAGLKSQTPCIIWMTGLSGAGKSTIANLLEKKLVAAGRHTYLLDGDNVRHGLNKDLGFTEADRIENIRRVGEVAKLMLDAGLIVITAFISPFRSERDMARQLVDTGEFIEVFVDSPLAVAEQRDVKGLYKKARRGELPNFTGIDSPYEVPLAAECHLDTFALTAQACADQIMQLLTERRII